MSDQEKFTNLVHECRGIIFKVIRLYVDDKEDEKDLFQEILFQAWRSFPNFQSNSKFSTWLYKVSLNTVLTFKRKNILVKNKADINDVSLHGDDPSRSDEVDALYQAIKSLGSLDKMIITLHLDGYENEEIAEIAGITKNHLAVKLFRIKEVLASKLTTKAK